LALTPEGQRLHADIAPLALAYEAALLAGLEPQEVRVLKRLLGRLETAALRLSAGR
jgi:DNA-binding MarR family transcriptional regulator